MNILFVSLADTCRSPAAKGVFEKLAAEAALSGSLRCDAAGTASLHTGSPPDRRMRQIGGERGVELRHAARKLAGDDFHRFDYVVVMDEAGLSDVRTQSYRSSGFHFPEERLFLLREFDPEARTGAEENLDIPDPYYENIGVFEETYDVIERCVSGFMDFLTQKHSLNA